MPNYGILQNIAAQQPQRGSGVLSELMSGLGAMKQTQMMRQEEAIKAQEHELKKNQALAAAEELRQMPELHKMKQEQHAANLAQANLNMQATRQGMGTESLRQQQLKHQMRMAQAEATFKLTGGVLGAPEEKQAEAYQTALKVAKNYGLPTDNLPQQWNDEAKAFARHAYTQSGNELEQMKAKAALAQQPLEKVINPETGQPMLVQRSQAAGMVPYEAPKGGGESTLDKEKAKQLVRMQDASFEQSSAAEQTLADLNAFRAASSKIPLGTGKSASLMNMFNLNSDVQNANQAAKNMTRNLMSAIKGAASDRDVALIAESNVDIGRSPDANRKIGDRIEAGALRIQQKPLFEQAMVEQGVTDPGKIRSAWTKFTNENPLINPKTGEVNSDNIANWQKYVNPTAAAAQKRFSSGTSNISAGQIVVGADGKRYQKVEGGYMPIGD